MDRQEERFFSVLKAISSASTLEVVQKMAALAADGLEPGSIEWRYTSMYMMDPSSEGFCVTCGRGYSGECLFEVFEDKCPAEIGGVRYAGCSADG
jgi:hypothetical protein